MNCEDVMKYIKEHKEQFWYGGLPEQLEAQIDEHLSHCEKCLEAIENLALEFGLYQVTAEEEAEIEGLVRAGFPLTEAEERKRNQKVIQAARQSVQSTGESVLDRFVSVFEAFLASRQIEPALAAESTAPEFVDELRQYYNENLVQLPAAQVHLSIEPDANHLILHFITDTDLTDKRVVIYKEGAYGSRIERKVSGEDVTFALSELGLKIGELNRVTFRLFLTDTRYIEGTL